MSWSGVKPPILYRYIAREILVPFLVTLFVFTGILFLARSLKLVDLVINKNVSIGDIVVLFSLIIPKFLEIALPMSLLLAVIFAFGRMSSDSELVVMRSAGMNIRQLALPVFGFAFASLLVAIGLAFWLRPWADYRLALGLFEIAKTQASAGLSAGIFNEIGQLTIYAEQIDDSRGTMNRVVIGDRRNPDQSRTFIAKHGRIISDQLRRTLSLELYDGTIPEGTGLDFTITDFEINSISLPHSELLGDESTKSGKRSNEMFIGELTQAIAELEATTDPADSEQAKSLLRAKVEWHKRLAVPAACLCVVLLAMPLGIQPSRGGHTWGAALNFAVGITFILLYYFALAVASALGENQILPPGLSMWTPNLIFGALGLYMFRKMGSEQWMAVSQAVSDGIIYLATKIKRRVDRAGEQPA